MEHMQIDIVNGRLQALTIAMEAMLSALPAPAANDVAARLLAALTELQATPDPSVSDAITTDVLARLQALAAFARL